VPAPAAAAELGAGKRREVAAAPRWAVAPRRLQTPAVAQSARQRLPLEAARAAPAGLSTAGSVLLRPAATAHLRTVGVAQVEDAPANFVRAGSATWLVGEAKSGEASGWAAADWAADWGGQDLADAGSAEQGSVAHGLGAQGSVEAGSEEGLAAQGSVEAGSEEGLAA